MDKIPIISLWQPWGNWVSLGWKQIETRTHKRFTKLEGQTIGIHLALKWDKEWYKLAGEYLTNQQIAQTERFLKIGGAIICLADVVEFRELNQNDSNKSLIDCGDTFRYGLIFDNIRKINAIPCKGRQGIFYEEILNNKKFKKSKGMLMPL